MEYAEHFPARLSKIKHLRYVRYVQARPEVDFWPILKRYTSL